MTEILVTSLSHARGWSVDEDRGTRPFHIERMAASSDKLLSLWRNAVVYGMRLLLLPTIDIADF